MREFAQPLPHGTASCVAFMGHPLHPIVVPFPIAFLIAVLATDLGWWYTQDPFWARLSVWLAGAGTVSGVVAGLLGTAEVLIQREIRMRVAAWSHFVVAVMLLAVAGVNWGLRLQDAETVILPWGLYLSAMGAGLVGAAGWLGGSLVFDHLVGVSDRDEEDAPPA